MKPDEITTTKPDTTIAEQSSDKPKVIKAEISIEIIGEDEPTVYEKSRKRWARVTRWSLLGLAVSLLSGVFFGINIYTFAACGISTVVFWIALDGAGTTSPEEPGYYDIPCGFGL